MGKTLLISVVCFAVMLLGVTGVHAHMPGTLAGAHAHSSAHEAAYVVSIVDADHAADHDDDGDVDIDPATKAFGELPLDAPAMLVATWIAIVVLAICVVSQLLPASRPLRPPRDRPRFYLLPPSHAPPSRLA